MKHTFANFLVVVTGSAALTIYAQNYGVPQTGAPAQNPQGQASSTGVELPQIGANKIDFSQLPQPVQNTLALYAGDTPIRNLSQAQLNDQPVYRAEFDRAGIHHELFISPNGQIAVQVQQTASALAPMKNVRPIALKDTPKSVQQSVHQHARVGVVNDVDQANWNGQTVYSVVVDNHGSLSQYVFDQNGKVLSEPGQSISEAAGAQPNHSKEPNTDTQHDHHILQQPK